MAFDSTAYLMPQGCWQHFLHMSAMPCNTNAPVILSSGRCCRQFCVSDVQTRTPWNSSHSSSVLSMTVLCHFVYHIHSFFRRFRDTCSNSFQGLMTSTTKVDTKPSSVVKDRIWSEEQAPGFLSITVWFLSHVLTVFWAKLGPLKVSVFPWAASGWHRVMEPGNTPPALKRLSVSSYHSIYMVNRKSSALSRCQASAAVRVSHACLLGSSASGEFSLGPRVRLLGSSPQTDTLMAERPRTPEKCSTRLGVTVPVFGFGPVSTPLK